MSGFEGNPELIKSFIDITDTLTTFTELANAWEAFVRQINALYILDSPQYCSLAAVIVSCRLDVLGLTQVAAIQLENGKYLCLENGTIYPAEDWVNMAAKHEGRVFNVYGDPVRS